METHNVQPGTEKWLMLRAYYDTASEAPAMMGDSKYMTRDQLMKQKVTRESEPVTDHLQALFDRGHAAEAAIRPHIVKLIGQELFPATGSIEADGLNLLASFDGLTMDDGINFEHKLWNEKLAERVRNNDLEDQYKWQMDQQMMVSGASRTIFVTSDGTPDKMEFCWYDWNPDRAVRLLAGWKQFNEDRANYVYVPEPELIKAKPVIGLPAVSIKVDGQIALIDNLTVFGEALERYVGQINKNPATDQDFADLESTVKTLKNAEDALNSAENGALAQATSIDTMRRTVDLYRTMARDNRLITEKLVKNQKEVIRNKIISDAQNDLSDHIAGLNKSLGVSYILLTSLVFGKFREAAKGKRTITTLQGAANDELARAKIEANEIAEKIRANLKALEDHAAEYKFLFNDVQSIIHKDASDFVLLVKARVAERQKVELEKAEAERERIRDEEVARIAEEQRLAEEQEQIDEAARIAAEKKKTDEVELKQVLVDALNEDESPVPVEVAGELTVNLNKPKYVAPLNSDSVSVGYQATLRTIDPHAELKNLLGKAIGVDAEDFDDELMHIFIWIGKGIAWSPDLHLKAKILADQAEAIIDADKSGVSARA